LPDRVTSSKQLVGSCLKKNTGIQVTDHSAIIYLCIMDHTVTY
jgi:hypothetical protein